MSPKEAFAVPPTDDVGYILSRSTGLLHIFVVKLQLFELTGAGSIPFFVLVAWVS